MLLFQQAQVKLTTIDTKVPHSDMQRTFQSFVDGLAESLHEESLRTVMEAASCSFDLHCFAYLVLPGRPETKARLISNYPTAWTSYYLESHYERLDPVILQALTESEPFEWGGDIGVVKLSREQHEILEQAAFFGIRYGYTIPIHDGHGPIAAVTFASEERAPAFKRCIEGNGRVLQLMALYFHAHARRKLATDRSIDGVLLTPREFECLRWASRGKTAWEIATILGISRRTASFHLDNTRAKLGVHSICEAVARFVANQIRMM